MNIKNKMNKQEVSEFNEAMRSTQYPYEYSKEDIGSGIVKHMLSCSVHEHAIAVNRKKHFIEDGYEMPEEEFVLELFRQMKKDCLKKSHGVS